MQSERKELRQDELDKIYADIPSEFIDGMSENMYFHPVVVTGGRTYEQKFVDDLIAAGNPLDPETRKPIKSYDTNWDLNKRLQAYLAGHPEASHWQNEASAAGVRHEWEAISAAPVAPRAAESACAAPSAPPVAVRTMPSSVATPAIPAVPPPPYSAAAHSGPADQYGRPPTAAVAKSAPAVAPPPYSAAVHSGPADQYGRPPTAAVAKSAPAVAPFPYSATARSVPVDQYGRVPGRAMSTSAGETRLLSTHSTFSACPATVVARSKAEARTVADAPGGAAGADTRSHDYLVKVVVVGESRSGKSCLMLKYADGMYTDEYIQHLGVDFKCRNEVVATKKLKLQIYEETAYQRKWGNRSLYRNINAVVVCVDSTEESGFSDTRSKLELIDCWKSPDTIVILAVTKCGAIPERIMNEIDEYKINTGITCIYTSAKTGDKVDEVFQTIARQYLQLKDPAALAACAPKDDQEKSKKSGCFVM